MNSIQAQLKAEESKIALLLEQLASSIAKKSYLRKVMILTEGKVKEQACCLSEQLDLEIMKASDLNTSVILFGLLEDFQVLSFFAGSVLRLSLVLAMKAAKRVSYVYQQRRTKDSRQPSELLSAVSVRKGSSCEGQQLPPALAALRGYIYGQADWP